MAFTEDQTRALNAPLEKAHVKERTQSGRTLSYIESWKSIEEANRIFGFDGWTRETVDLIETNRDLVELKGQTGPYSQWRIGYIAKVRVTAGGVVREGTGYGSGMGKPEAIGEAVEGAVKEAESDAMKRALMTFGYPFGLALYDKTQANVAEPVKEARKVPALSDRADQFEDVLRKTKIDDLPKVWAKGAQLCAQLDTSMPERLAELTTLYEGLSDPLPFD